jgi:hypothetical protein
VVTEQNFEVLGYGAERGGFHSGDIEDRRIGFENRVESFEGTSKAPKVGVQPGPSGPHVGHESRIRFPSIRGRACGWPRRRHQARSSVRSIRVNPVTNRIEAVGMSLEVAVGEDAGLGEAREAERERIQEPIENLNIVVGHHVLGR